MRNEAHRFGISHHRGKREKDQVHSELDDIKGVGEKTREKLLLHFESVETIKNSTEEQLSNVVGSAMANKLIAYFLKKEE
jgi:excinuclease ABC subunit C